uniref:Sema domain-containing protein n=1 Tax=Loxodonta africana TaxID=9785 RepID=G3SX85_LOXAF
ASELGSAHSFPLSSRASLGTRRFKGRAPDYSILLLEEASGRLLVGARGALFSLNALDIGDGTHKEIPWEASPEMQSKCHQKGKNNQTECFNHVRFLQRLNATHLYTCGTHAFQPLCAAIDAEAFTLPTSFEEGKEKCPYDPAHGFTGLIIDGGLYTATRYEFRSIPDIRRSRHPYSLRTEEAPMHWLNDAEFVFSVLARESEASAVGDDDKVYYFFTERAAEEGSGSFTQSRSSHRVARVARVCKGDLGGKKILQKKWTSFLKARLICHIPQYETLRGVCSLDAGNSAHTRFYAAFTLTTQCRKTLEASAVCRYDLAEVQAPTWSTRMASDAGAAMTVGVPEPRPGSLLTPSCLDDPLSQNSVTINVDASMNIHSWPLVTMILGLLWGLRADPIAGLISLTLCPFNASDGWIHKAVVLGSGMHIIEEIQVLREPQSVENLVISLTQHSLYVGAPSGVIQLPLSSCSRYDSCYDCILARDPYCGWDPST